MMNLNYARLIIVTACAPFKLDILYMIDPIAIYIVYIYSTLNGSITRASSSARTPLA